MDGSMGSMNGLSNLSLKVGGYPSAVPVQQRSLEKYGVSNEVPRSK